MELDEHEGEDEQHQQHQQHEEHEHAQERESSGETAALNALHQLCEQEKEKAEAARMRAEAEKKRATQLQEQLGHALAEIAVERQVPSLVLLPPENPGFQSTRAHRRGAVVWLPPS